MSVCMCVCVSAHQTLFSYNHVGPFMQTVDQFFALQVPMRLTELNCLLRGIDNAFQVYANRIIENMGKYCIQTFDLISRSHFYFYFYLLQ